MGERQDIIKRLLEMQRQFIEFEHEHGVDQADYFSPDKGHALEGYRQEYYDLAKKLVDLSHEEKGSHR